MAARPAGPPLRSEEARGRPIPFVPRRNLYDQQVGNRRKTAIVIGLFVLLVLFLGYGVDRIIIGINPVNGFWQIGPLGRRAPKPIGFPVGTMAALGIGSLSAWLGYRRGDTWVLASSRAVPLIVGDLKSRQLDNVVEEMAIAAGLPKPRVFVVPDQDPNAFAIGRDPAHASIAVTRGLLEMMSREELQGVVAHEMAHIRNYDTRVMTVTAALLGALLLLHDWSARIGPWRGRNPRGRRTIGTGQALVSVVWVLLVVLAPLLGQLIAMLVSRTREYVADATGAELTRNPLGLASALRKLEAATAPTRSISRGTAPLCICDPLDHPVNEREGFWANLLATHPPMAERIRILEAMAYAS